jgi:ubiquinone/menaquinone biosynthesis C-methylase UbiE
MSQTDNLFAGSIPALYDQYLGSLLFQPYARDIADRLPYLTEGRLLETAAGTGIVTRALAAALSNQVQIVATDLNQPMIDHAATQLSSSRVTWRQADALNLPFEDSPSIASCVSSGSCLYRISLKPIGKFCAF